MIKKEKFCCQICRYYNSVIVGGRCSKTGDTNIAWRAHRTCCGRKDWHVRYDAEDRNEKTNWGTMAHRVFKSSFLPEDAFFVVDSSRLFSSIVSNWAFKPQQYKREETPRIRYDIGQGDYTSSTVVRWGGRKTTFLEKLQRVPHIIKVAMMTGWRIRESANYFCYTRKLERHSPFGFSIVDTSA